MMSSVSSLRIAPHLRVAAEVLGASIVGTAHLVRENLKVIKSREKQKGYRGRVDNLYRDSMKKKQEVSENL